MTSEKPNRIPKKPLNPFVKGQLLAILVRNDIKISDKFYPGSSTITVTDAKGKFLFSYDNGWDYGLYRIHMAHPDPKKEPILVAEMEWYENDLNTNSQQQDVFDIHRAIDEKRKELQEQKEALKNLTPDEILALQALGITQQNQNG